MSFDAYARYYDDYYRTKDYARECDDLAAAFARHARGPVRRVLELGCGTGGHALVLAKRGMELVATDRSPGMLAQAREKARAAGLGGAVSFVERDMRDIGDPLPGIPVSSFDSVVCMFAALGYVTENADLARVFAGVRKQLRPGGVFVFDVWHGPGVLADLPGMRWSEVAAADGARIFRLARPEHDPVAHINAVEYRVLVIRGQTLVEEVREHHRVRYFFVPELRELLAGAGLELVEASAFGAPGREPGPGDWNVSIVARAP